MGIVPFIALYEVLETFQFGFDTRLPALFRKDAKALGGEFGQFGKVFSLIR